jgi:hypothetical protein
MDIRPRQFSVVGKLNINEQEESMLSFIWGGKSYGRAKPLLGIFTTNGVEGQNNSFKWKDIQQ